MLILIKGMEMPRSCAYCDVACRFFLDRGLDGLLAKICRTESRLPDCPLVPVPPHGRLGDLDKLEQMFSDIDHAPYSSFDGSEPFYSAEDAAQIIRLAPTIIPAEEGGDMKKAFRLCESCILRPSCPTGVALDSCVCGKEIEIRTCKAYVYVQAETDNPTIIPADEGET